LLAALPATESPVIFRLEWPVLVRVTDDGPPVIATGWLPKLRLTADNSTVVGVAATGTAFVPPPPQEVEIRAWTTSVAKRIDNMTLWGSVLACT
jgi:hypothetical protein